MNSDDQQMNAGADNTTEGFALAACEKKMVELQVNHPDWYELFEDTFPDNAPREEVVELMASAPTDFAKGLMFGKFSMRLELEAVTGRAFE